MATGEMTGLFDLPGVLLGQRQVYLYDYATPVPVWRFDEPESRVSIERYGQWWTAIVCCGPGAHLPAPESITRHADGRVTRSW